MNTIKLARDSCFLDARRGATYRWHLAQIFRAAGGGISGTCGRGSLQNPNARITTR